MTTKTAAQKPVVKEEARLPDDLKTAHQVHTLAQMIYMRATASPWTPMVQAPFPPVLH